MKILYVAQSFYPKVGGVENYIDSIASFMVKKGHEVYVLAPLYPGCEEHEKFHDYDIIRLDFKENLKKGIFYHLRAINFLPSFLKALNQIRPDVVHFQYTNPFGILFLMVKLRGIKCFASAHGNDILFFKNDWFAKHLLKLIVNNMTGIFAVSDNSKDLLLSAGGKSDKIHVVYNGTDLNKFKPQSSANKKIDKTSKRVLTVCRVVERKGVDTLINAFNKVLKIKHAELYVVGEGPIRPRLEKLAKKLGIDANVHFTGKVSEKELLAHYNKCDVFVLVSRVLNKQNEVEGFGISIVEAMACGKPVIGSNVGGIPSAIKGDWGFLVDPLDENELAEKLLTLLKNPKKAKLMGEKGRKAVEKTYNWEVITNRFLKFYTG
ncbi:glycosyltransferase family 4 protein [[Eubacterium] cellulosolvens]